MAKKAGDGVKKLMDTPAMKGLKKLADDQKQAREEAKRREEEAKRKKR